MEPDLQKRIEEIEKKLDAIYRSTEKTRKYIFWTIVATVITFIMPLIGLIFALPYYFQILGQYAKF